jgi:hypothetical protein
LARLLEASIKMAKVENKYDRIGTEVARPVRVIPARLWHTRTVSPEDVVHYYSHRIRYGRGLVGAISDASHDIR